MRKYNKIYSPFERHTERERRNKLDFTQWTSQELKLLAGVPGWHVTEKVDGTNVRVHWDGHKVTYGGRTDAAQMPVHLVNALDMLFHEEIFEQTFGERVVTLFGEGFGPKIQKVGGLYSDKVGFALFDVYGEQGDYWFSPDAVRDIGLAMGIGKATVVGEDYTLYEVMKVVGKGFVSTYSGNTCDQFFAEGLIARAPLGLRDRSKGRIMAKVKHVDFYGQYK